MIISVLQDLVVGKESAHSEIALAAVNVIIRMAPIQKNMPFYTKKLFFNVMQARPLGGGLELAEGWFQLRFFSLSCSYRRSAHLLVVLVVRSVRPAMGKLLINLGTTSTVV